MRDHIQRYRPNLKWYHYLVIAYLGLPVGASGSTDPYVTLGSLIGAFAAVWGLVTIGRRLSGLSGQGSGQAREGDDASTPS